MDIRRITKSKGPPKSANRVSLSPTTVRGLSLCAQDCTVVALGVRRLWPVYETRSRHLVTSRGSYVSASALPFPKLLLAASTVANDFQTGLRGPAENRHKFYVTLECRPRSGGAVRKQLRLARSRPPVGRMQAAPTDKSSGHIQQFTISLHLAQRQLTRRECYRRNTPPLLGTHDDCEGQSLLAVCLACGRPSRRIVRGTAPMTPYVHRSLDS